MGALRYCYFADDPGDIGRHRQLAGAHIGVVDRHDPTAAEPEHPGAGHHRGNPAEHQQRAQQAGTAQPGADGNPRGGAQAVEGDGVEGNIGHQVVSCGAG